MEKATRDAERTVMQSQFEVRMQHLKQQREEEAAAAQQSAQAARELQATLQANLQEQHRKIAALQRLLRHKALSKTRL